MTEHAAEVLAEIRQRRDAPSRLEPACRRGTRLGLVVEGGAMRGAISMAYLAALERQRMNTVFDDIFAESAGAVNAAYFVSGQAETGLELYRRAARSPGFLHKWRLHGILDLDAVFEPIADGELSLDCDRLRRSPTVVTVSLTDCAHGEPATLVLEGSDERIRTILKATSAVVPYYNRAVLLEGRGFVDGGIADPVPVLRAIEAGCSHILVLLTRPEDYRPRRLRFWERALTRLLVAPWGSDFRHVFHHSRPQRYYLARSLALGREKPPAAVRIAALAPPAALGRMDRFSNSADRIEAVLQSCSSQMESLLSNGTPGAG